MPVLRIWVVGIARAGNDSRGRPCIRKRAVTIVDVNVRSEIARYAVNRDQHVEVAVIINVTPTRTAPGSGQRITVDSGTVRNIHKALRLAAWPRHENEHCCHSCDQT